MLYLAYTGGSFNFIPTSRKSEIKMKEAIKEIDGGSIETNDIKPNSILGNVSFTKPKKIKYSITAKANNIKFV